MALAPADRIGTGLEGLDEIIGGGLIPHRSYLVRGAAGSGKTALGFHFIAAGVAAGERCLMITLGESAESMRQNSQRFGFQLDGVELLDLSPTSDAFAKSQSYDIFTPADVEREPMTRRIIEWVERLKPARVFLDGITQFRYLVGDDSRFHRQTLSFMRYLGERGSTLLFTSEPSRSFADDDLQFLCDGVITLRHLRHKRALRVHKFRGSDFQPGFHSMRITSEGLRVFPRLVPHEYRRDFVPEAVPSGIDDLDTMLRGGLERGTVTFITGPTGVGKTTLAMHFLRAAVDRGERAAIFTFEEAVQVMAARCEAIGAPMQQMIEQGLLHAAQVEPLRYTPDEFAQIVRHDVQERETRLVVIDSVAGYRLSLDGDELVTDMHALCKFLKNMGVTVILINDVARINGPFRPTEHGLSYLADSIIYLRYLERRGVDGTVRLSKCLGVLKKRVTDFDPTLRPFEITPSGIRIGLPMKHLGSILSAMPKDIVDGGPED